MMRLSAAALVAILGIALGGCATQTLAGLQRPVSDGPFADAVVFADVNCSVSTTGTVVHKQNCNDLTIDDHTGQIVQR